MTEKVSEMLQNDCLACCLHKYVKEIRDTVKFAVYTLATTYRSKIL